MPSTSIDWDGLHQLGFSLIPVRVGDKIPAIQWSSYQTRRAMPDEIAKWRSAGHNAGIVTGALSDLVVLDCDTLEAVAQAEKLGIPESTVSVRTAKACHIYFRHPGFPVSNKTSILPGMDIRGDGGFVVAPGSIHATGVLYRWINHPAWNDIPSLPEWLLDMLRSKPADLLQTPAPPATALTSYGRGALDRELTVLRFTQEGGRNHQLNRSAHALAQLAAGGQIDTATTKAALTHAALSIGLDADEIERTIESGWQAGSRLPRSPRSSDIPPSHRPILISAAELATLVFPELQWAIPGILPEGLGILAGRPKLGKSFLALQMALAVAAGDGGAFGVEGIEAGDVLYCALEDSKRRLKSRLDKMYPFGYAPNRLNFATDWPRLNQGGIEELEAWCEEKPAARLIILDTWRAIKPAAAGRGSAYDEDASAAAPLLEFAKHRPGVAVVVVHHVRKAEADDVFDTISGTHGLTGIFDTLMVLSRHGEGAILTAQGRDLDGYEKALERNRRTGGWTVKGEAIALAKTGERQELLDLLTKADRPLSLSEIAGTVRKNSDTARHLLKPLIDAGLIYQPSHGKYALPLQLAQNAQFDDKDHLFE